MIIADDVLALPPPSVQEEFRVDGRVVFQIPDALDIELASAAVLRGR